MRKIVLSAILRGITNILFILRALRRNLQTVFFTGFILTFAVVLGVVFFLRARSHMEMQLKESLRLNVSIATQQFSASDIEAITGRASMKSAQFKKVVHSLRRLRDEVPNVKFAYILRKTQSPTMLEFVADADSLATDTELDKDGDGVVSPEEQVASYPGDPYDILQAPAMASGFIHPVTDDKIIRDQWGATMSGYAPIYGKDGVAVAVLGIDMDAGDFLRLTQSVFSPFAFLIFIIMIVLLVAYIAIFIWQRRIESFQRIDQERSGVMLLTFHQLGTPLTIASWSLETLLDALDKGEPLETAVREHAKNMGIAIADLKNVLTSLKTASMVEEGSLAYKAELAPLADLVWSVVIEQCSQLDRNNQRVDVKIDPKLQVPLDRSLIGGVLRELITNAITFSRPGGQIIVEAHVHRDAVHISVVDHGVGVPKKDIPRLFNKFVRGRNASNIRTEGSGMGLFVARGIVRRAGGDIWLESTEGLGTTVTFTLPLSPRVS